MSYFALDSGFRSGWRTNEIDVEQTIQKSIIYPELAMDIESLSHLFHLQEHRSHTLLTPCSKKQNSIE